MDLTATLAVPATLAFASTAIAESLELRSICKPLLSQEERDRYVKAVAQAAYEKYRVVGEGAVTVFRRYVMMSYAVPPAIALMNPVLETRFYVRDDHHSAMILALFVKTDVRRRGKTDVTETETCVGFVLFYPKAFIDIILDPNAAQPSEHVGT